MVIVVRIRADIGALEGDLMGAFQPIVVILVGKKKQAPTKCGILGRLIRVKS